ncbi:hypothetical protein EMSIMAW_00035 [Enterococcus phage vB_OCPT_PG2]|nr:hypothetical protein EMSIMAW_00035 [Enterococcus phage vB_OCPT_PG2]
MNESIYDGIPEIELYDKFYGVFIKFRCNNCLKPLAMHISDLSKEMLDATYLQREEGESNIILKDINTGLEVAFDLTDVVAYSAKEIEVGDTEAYYSFAEHMANMMLGEDGQ